MKKLSKLADIFSCICKTGKFLVKLGYIMPNFMIKRNKAIKKFKKELLNKNMDKQYINELTELYKENIYVKTIFK